MKYLSFSILIYMAILSIPIACQATPELSDGRIKENIQNITPEESLERVLMLRAKSFVFAKGGNDSPAGLQRGFIAQDVKEVIPELVQIGGSIVVDDSEFYDAHSLNYSKLTADLTGAVQATYTRVEELEEEVAMLHDELEGAEARVKSLEKENQELRAYFEDTVLGLVAELSRRVKTLEALNK